MRVNWIRDPHRAIPVLNFYLYIFTTHTRAANPSKLNKNIGSIRCWSTQVCKAFCSGGFWFWLWRNDKGNSRIIWSACNMDRNSIWNVLVSIFYVFVRLNQPKYWVESLMLMLYADYDSCGGKILDGSLNMLEWLVLLFLYSINSRLINDAMIGFTMREESFYVFFFLNDWYFIVHIINYTILIALLKLYYFSCFSIASSFYYESTNTLKINKHIKIFSIQSKIFLISPNKWTNQPSFET